MCRSTVAPEAEHALADVLRDIATALAPEHPERVVIGPVDFAANAPDRSRRLRPAPDTLHRAPSDTTHSDQAGDPA